MRSICTLLVLAGLITLGVALQGSNAVPPGPAQAAPGLQKIDDPLIVHEWGTFTSVSGSDGVRLEFRPLVDNDLPEFVLNRPRQSGTPDLSFSKLSYRVFQRMETPVTYFYTRHERQVQVKVGFPRGLLTEFYPPVAGMKPEFHWQKRAAIGNSELDWGRVTLIPTGHLQTDVTTPGSAAAVQQRLLDAMLPGNQSHDHYPFATVPQSAHYTFARETDSAILHVQRPPVANRPFAPQGDFFEKFLFYRGLGNFTLPLQVNAAGEDEFEIVNTGLAPIRSLFLVTVHEKQVRFQKVDQLPAGGRMKVRQTTQNSTVDDLSQAVVSALTDERLYEKEARAMVKTWRDSWFEEEGTRLFYMLPSGMTDELLPLTISPQPDELVRVMVGRLEVMTPEAESRIRDIVRASSVRRVAAAKRQAELQARKQKGEQVEEPVTDGTPEPLPEALLALGRLAEPALVRAKYFSAETAIKSEAELLLNELHALWTAEAQKQSP